MNAKVTEATDAGKAGKVAPGVDPDSPPETGAEPQQETLDTDGITLQELQALLPEEAGVLEDAAKEAAAAKASETETAEEAAATETKEAEAAAATETKGTAAEATAAAPKLDIWTETQGTIPAPDMAKIGQQKAELTNARDALNNKFAAGDIEQAEYMRDLQKILNDIAHLDQIPQAHQMAQDAQQNAIQQRWTDTVKLYEDANPELVKPEHVRGWDAELRAVTSTYPSLNFNQAIRLAHQRYEQTAQALGSPLTESKSGPVTLNPANAMDGQGSAAAPQTKSEIESKLTEKTDAPVTLRDVPGESAMATAPQIGDALDAVLDQGDPYAAEALFGRMSPVQQEAYLRGEI